MIHRIPYTGPRDELEPIPDVELGIAALLLVLTVLLAVIIVPLIG